MLHADAVHLSSVSKTNRYKVMHLVLLVGVAVAILTNFAVQETDEKGVDFCYYLYCVETKNMAVWTLISLMFFYVRYAYTKIMYPRRFLMLSMAIECETR
eukprot:TRINITY_DN14332_c0_g1_i2.p1 TRINITY_DN14332_c0_g1~~TRINITY_DN14332_c0_g1_i2.p1  ORF type:complete len:100 (-),score=7.52 TRINITY_DN14332_c0_g1_i2:93-392(-)